MNHKQKLGYMALGAGILAQGRAGQVRSWNRVPCLRFFLMQIGAVALILNMSGGVLR